MPLPAQENTILPPSASRSGCHQTAVVATVHATLVGRVRTGQHADHWSAPDAAVAKPSRQQTQATESAKEAVDQARTAMLDSVEGAKQSAERVNDTLARDSDDVAITASVSAGPLKDPDLSALKIDVDTRNGVVSMYGLAPTAAAKDRATTIARAVKGVASVNNELTVKRT